MKDKASTARPNPRRVEAGRLNRLKRGVLTPQGMQSLRAAALRGKPWNYSTGPRTPAGKAQAVRNGKKRQLGPISVREARALVADAAGLIQRMGESRTLMERALNARRGTGPAADP
jgi:hypothetical protein